MKFFLASYCINQLEEENKIAELEKKGFNIGKIHKDWDISDGYIEINTLKDFILFFDIIGCCVRLEYSLKWVMDESFKYKYELNIKKRTTVIDSFE